MLQNHKHFQRQRQPSTEHTSDDYNDRHIMHFSLFAVGCALISSSLAAPVTEERANSANPLVKRVQCNSEAAGVCSETDANNIVNTLIAQGTQVYTIGHYHHIIISSGSCHLTAYASGSSASSYARDIGYGTQTIVQDCTYNGQVQGNNAAGGNGNFQISLSTCGNSPCGD